MLIIRLHPGESVKAEDRFELVFDGADERGAPLISVLSLFDTKYQVAFTKSNIAVSELLAGRLEKLELLFGSTLTIGESSMQLSACTAERLKLAIVAPRSIRFTRPAQHGGSLLAG